jgi:hypothetical protein
MGTTGNLPTLSAEVQKCLNTTNRLLGHSVSLIPDSTLGRNQYGFSDIENGIPKLWFRPVQPFLDTTIIHELLHLQLRAMGFPVYGLHVRRRKDLGILATPQRMERLVNLPNQVSTTIEHFITYRMMSLNFPQQDPTRELRTDIQRLIGSQIGGTDPTLASWYRTVTYFQCAVELVGDPLLHQIADWFRGCGWTRELRLGKKMSIEVHRRKPSSPRTSAITVTRCLNILLSNLIKFRLRKTEPEAGGKRRAVLTLCPVW